MKILITAFGTRGDIQPFIALGIGLKNAGHEVAISTSEGYRSFVEEHRLGYVFMSNELLQLTQDSLDGTGGITGTFRTIKKIPIAVRSMMDDEWNAALLFKPNLIIYHPKCLGSLHVAEKLNIPVMASLPLPFYTPTREFPVPFMSGIRLGKWFNLLIDKSDKCRTITTWQKGNLKSANSKNKSWSRNTSNRKMARCALAVKPCACTGRAILSGKSRRSPLAVAPA